MQLTCVGDPLVDQNQARTVLDEQLAQHVARARRLLIVLGDAGERLLAAKLPGQLAPQRTDHGAVRLGRRISWGDLVADEHHALHLRQALGAGLAHHRIGAGQVRDRRPGKQVIQGEHRVRLAAAEVRLQLDDRIAAFAADPPNGADEEALQAFGEVGPPEELLRVLVLGAALADVDLPEIRRELRLLVPSTRDVGVGRHHLTPRLQTSRGCALDQRAANLLLLVADLFLEGQPPKLQHDLVDLFGFRRRDRRQQPDGGIERTLGVAARIAFLVRPLVSPAAKLRHEVALADAEGRAEDVVPCLPHQLQQPSDVPLARSACLPESGLR